MDRLAQDRFDLVVVQLFLGQQGLGELFQPAALLQWARQLGPALYTSPHWASSEPIRLLALSGYRMATEPERASEIANEYEAWTLRVGGGLARAA